MRRMIITVLLLPLVAVQGIAQSMTFNHDEVVMNQFTVGETGAGNLGGSNFQWYYDLFHNSYRSWAPETNKQAFRLTTYYSIHNEVPYAEKIDTCLKERAKIEALNLADRQIDLAWAFEKDKVEHKKEMFQKNINKIVSSGGTSEDKRRWQNIYNAIDAAIRNVQDSYLPNSERQKSYILMYKDLVRYNTELVGHLSEWSGHKLVKKYKDAVTPAKTPVGRHAVSCFARWRTAMRVGGTGGGGGTGGVQGIGID